MTLARVRTARDAEPIAAALELLPPGIERRLRHVRFVAGADPVFVGLHAYEEIEDGRSYRTTAHACFPEHLQHRPRPERVTTIALPVAESTRTVVHELGHALHEAISFDCRPPEPVSAYATLNEHEAFAEAFTAWLMPELYPWVRPIQSGDAATTRLFRELAR